MHNEFLRIEGNDSLVRDISSGAIVNTDRTEYERYMLKKVNSAQLKNQVQQNSEDIAELRKDIGEIKDLLRLLVANK